VSKVDAFDTINVKCGDVITIKGFEYEDGALKRLKCVYKKNGAYSLELQSRNND